MERDVNSEGQNLAIDVKNVSKTFKLPHEKYSSVKSIFINFYKRKRTFELQHALKDVSFDIKKGEFFGIVGRNGSGKSTLLKLLAGIYTPTHGKITVNGSLTPFIELGVGFNPELTGRENVYLNGALLGFNRKEMRAMYKDIVEFAELEKFMDQKLKNYSSGMQVRLAFSIAIRAQSDILLLDEVLAVGDGAFQQKCYDHFSELKRQRKTIILVSHSMDIIERYCNKAMLVDGGKVKRIGSSAEIASMYNDMFLQEEIAHFKEHRSNERSAYNGIRIISSDIIQNGSAKSEINASEDFEVRVKIKAEKPISNLNLGVNIKNRDRIMVISAGSEHQIEGINLKSNQSQIISFKFKNVLVDGLYSLNVGVADASSEMPKIISRLENATVFTVAGGRSKAMAKTDVKISTLN
jgi:ABC-2 type transport system ATP-binding protein